VRLTCDGQITLPILVCCSKRRNHVPAPEPVPRPASLGQDTLLPLRQAADRASVLPLVEPLTAREVDVLRLVVEGVSNARRSPPCWW
jgi:hypothetical protein